MASPDSARLAVLVDADNTSPKHATALLEEVAKYGVPTVKRAYGDWTNPHLGGWLALLPKHGIQPMLQVAHTRGKNSTDSALIIDAMDLLYSGNLDAFALVSSDSDFTSLAIRLRASGRTVYGLGLRKTPEALRQAVDRFIFLEDLHDAPEETVEEESAAGDATDEPASRRVPDLRRLLERAVDATADDDGWAHLSSIRNQITRVEPSFSLRDYGGGKMVDLVRSQDYLEVEQREDGPRVRRAERPAKKTAARSPAKRTARKAADEPAKKTTRRATRKTAETPPEPPPEPPVEQPVTEPVATAEPVPESTRPQVKVTRRRRSGASSGGSDR